MARALSFVPFTNPLDATFEASEKHPELRRRAEIIKDQVYRRHVRQVLSARHAEVWVKLDREQKLALIAQVAQQVARRELDQLQSKEPERAFEELMAGYVDRHGGDVGPGWDLLSSEERKRAFYSLAVRRFLKSVADEVLAELRFETWAGPKARFARA